MIPVMEKMGVRYIKDNKILFIPNGNNNDILLIIILFIIFLIIKITLLNKI